MLDITKDSFAREVEEHKGLVVIDLWAEWCGPCRLLAPVLDELERDYPEVKFCKINIDREPELTQAFGVQSIPMVALVKDNTFIDFSVGYVPRAKLEELIKNNLGDKNEDTV